jgi:tetratricopeptide (TPR) repeat protein
VLQQPNEPTLASELLKKGYDLRERASEREKFYISAHYYGIGTGEIEKENEVFEQWHRTYPRDSTPLDNLALNYVTVGLPEKAINAASEAMRLDPKDSYAFTHLANTYADMNRYDEAKSVVEQAVALKIDSLSIHLAAYRIAFIRADQADMQREVSWAAGKAREPYMLDAKASGEYALGRVRMSRDTEQFAIDSANHRGFNGYVSRLNATEAVRDAAYGYTVAARHKATETLRRVGAMGTKQLAALALAQIGDTAGAQKVADELNRDFPKDTMIQAVFLPMVRALRELQRNRPDEAIAALEPVRKYELGTGPGISAKGWPIYFRGQAFLRMHESAKAAAEFQKILDHRGALALTGLYPLAELNLARAYVQQSDTAKARATYQDFLALWKDADPDVPVLVQAKGEYAKLQ